MSDIPPAAPEPSESPKPQEAVTPPPVFDPNLFPSRHRPWKQWLLDHNPCLLLSTVLMLLGCYLVNTAIGGPDDLRSPLALLLVVNVYEACIIPLGLVLIRRTRGTARDGWWLLLFEILFLVNATFVNVDFRTGWGVPVNVLLFVLACIKAAVIMHGLKIGLSLRTFGFFALQLALIYGMPILFAYDNKDGIVSQRLMYALWWIVGLLPLAYDQLARWDDRRRARLAHAPQWDLVQQVVRRVFLMTPWVLLVVHLRFAHWAHHAPFSFADLSPVLLGLTIASLRTRQGSIIREAARLLPIAAMALAFTAPDTLSLTLVEPWAALHAVHITFAAIVATWAYLVSMPVFLITTGTMALACVCYIFQTWLRTALQRLAQVLYELLPKTSFEWGIAAITAAFVLLGIGSLLGLRRTAMSEAPETPKGA